MNSKYKQVKNIWSKKKNRKNFQRIREYIPYKSLLEKYPLSEFFWSVFSRIRARKTPNTDTFHTVNPSFSVYIYPTKYLHLSFLVKFRKKNNHQKSSSENTLTEETFAATLREKCPYSELFWSAFPRIRTE